MDGPAPAAPGSGRISSGFAFGAANPVPTFELQDPGQDSRILGPSMLLNSTSGQSETTSAASTEPATEAPAPAPSTTAKFSSVVGGTSGRTQGSTPAAAPTTAAAATDDASKRALETQNRQEPTRVDASKRHDAQRPAAKVESKRQEPKVCWRPELNPLVLLQCDIWPRVLTLFPCDSASMRPGWGARVGLFRRSN